jgi:hypothetical protein
LHHTVGRAAHRCCALGPLMRPFMPHLCGKLSRLALSVLRCLTHALCTVQGSRLTSPRQPQPSLQLGTVARRYATPRHKLKPHQWQHAWRVLSVHAAAHMVWRCPGGCST